MRLLIIREMKTLGQDILSREQRLNALTKILEDADVNDLELSKVEIQAKLKEAGHEISLASVYKDLKEIAKDDPFIRELASTTYSSIMHQAFKNYNKIYGLAMKIHDKPNQLTRSISRETRDGTFEEVIKDESSAVKLQALTVAKNAQDSIRLMVNGENLHKSASKWVESNKQQEATINQLREKLSKFENKPIIPSQD